MKYKPYKTEEEKKKKRKKLLAILLPILLGVTAAIVVPTTIILTRKQPDSPKPETKPYTGPTFKFDGTILLGFCDEVTPEIILNRFPNGTITIPECTEIANDAFDGKIPSAINELVLPSNTTKIGDNAFANNETISKISFYEDKDVGDWEVKEFGKKAFYNTGIKSFVFPPKLEIIGSDCFNKCNNLCYLDFTIYPKASKIVCSENSFSSLNKEGIVYVRKGTVDQWKISLFNAGLIDPDTLSEFSKYWQVIEFTCLDIDDKGVCYGFRQDIPKYLQFLIEEESKELLIPNNVVEISNSRNGFNDNLFIEKIIISSSVEKIDSESFKGCKNLQQIDVTDYEKVPSWTGNQIFIGAPEQGNVVINNRLRKKWRSLFENTSGLIIGDENWKVGYDEFALENCLCVKVTSGSSKFIVDNTKTQTVNLQYLVNNQGEWQEYSQPIQLAEGDSLFLKGNNPEGWNSTDTTKNVTTFWFKGGTISLSGSVMGLINNGYETSDIIPCDGCFRKLFMSNNSITEISQEFLSPLILKPYCYSEMFKYCKAIFTTPDLPAQKMEEGCYEMLFDSCTSIKHPVLLKSMQLAPYCYKKLYYGCLFEDILELPAQDLKPYCYELMFAVCRNIKKPCSLNSTKLAQGCYKSMFKNCPSLEQAPQLPATELIDECYYEMFYGCELISEISVNFNIWLDNATAGWLEGVSTNGQFICPNNLIEQRGTGNIPVNWEIVNS